MDEVWVVYLCMVLFAIILILMKQKPDDEIRKETDTRSASVSTSSYSSSSGRRLECTEEEIEASLQRLTGILFNADARRREPPHKHDISAHQKDQAEKELGESQPQLSRRRIQEKPTNPSSHEPLLDGIGLK